MNALTAAVALSLLQVQQGPDPEDVKAGWLGLTVFLLLVGAVAFLGYSLRKHLRRVDFPETDDSDAEPRNGPATPS